MHSACKDGSHGLQGGEDLHQGGGLHEDVGGLGHVSSVQVVVVGNTLQLRMFLILWVCVKIGGDHSMVRFLLRKTVKNHEKANQ